LIESYGLPVWLGTPDISRTAAAAFAASLATPPAACPGPGLGASWPISPSGAPGPGFGVKPLSVLCFLPPVGVLVVIACLLVHTLE
jgi:hypothetical protein